MTREERIKEIAIERENLAKFVSWAEWNKCIVQISYPRSGREWLYRLVEKVTAKPTMRIFDTREAPYEDYAYFYWHGHHYKDLITNAALRNMTFVTLVRDPRDCMISDAYRRVITDPDLEMSREVVLAARELLLDPLRGYYTRYATFNGPIIQYERLCLSPIAELQKMLDLLDIEITYPVDFAVRDNDRCQKVVIANELISPQFEIQSCSYKTGMDRYKECCLKWKRDNWFTEEDNTEVWSHLKPVMEQLGYTGEGHDLSKLETGLSTAGVWAIGETLLDTIKFLIPDDSKVLELGSGSGTAELAKFLDMTSIEHYSGWIGLYDSNYIHAPLKDGWYSVDKIQEQLNHSYKYSGILIDGPSGSENRAKFVDHMDLFDLSQWIFFDDIHREKEYAAYMEMIEKLGRSHGEYKDTNGKAFGIVTPYGQRGRLHEAAKTLGLVDYKNMEH